ncbi:hypothetical protein V5799_006028 [Amblyomma americanum]|uniref:Uncharacterized protein n=1 Tax=Amblyomma americanum TaxID=6943 RepID=A0AAQ4DXK0_AMBAM
MFCMYHTIPINWHCLGFYYSNGQSAFKQLIATSCEATVASQRSQTENFGEFRRFGMVSGSRRHEVS